MNGKLHNWRWKPKTILLTVGIFGVMAGVVMGYVYITHNTNPIPIQMRSQLAFSPFIITPDTKDYTADTYRLTTAENSIHILSYIIHIKNSTDISVSQYAQPQEFTDIPEYKDRFLSNIAKQYATVSTSNGTIYLGRQTLQNNKQLGVMLERGLLVFMSPDKEISQAQWRSLGDHLEIQKNTD